MIIQYCMYSYSSLISFYCKLSLRYCIILYCTYLTYINSSLSLRNVSAKWSKAARNFNCDIHHCGVRVTSAPLSAYPGGIWISCTLRCSMAWKVSL